MLRSRLPSHLPCPRRRHRRGQPAAHRVRVACYYLIATAEPPATGALRRRALRRRAAAAGGLIDMFMQSRAKVRQRGQAAHHARHLRALVGYYDAYYLKAQKVRTLIAGFSRRLRQVDVLLTRCPTPAFGLGEKTADRCRCTSRTSSPSGEPCGTCASASLRLLDNRPADRLQLIGKPFAEGSCCAPPMLRAGDGMA